MQGPGSQEGLRSSLAIRFGLQGYTSLEVIVMYSMIDYSRIGISCEGFSFKMLNWALAQTSSPSLEAKRLKAMRFEAKVIQQLLGCCAAAPKGWRGWEFRV